MNNNFRNRNRDNSADDKRITKPIIVEPPLEAPIIGEPNEIIPEAFDSELSSDNLGIFSGRGFIGDNPDIAPTDEVDLITFQLDAGDRVTIDIDAEIIGSSLDPILRLFDSQGNEVAFNDDSDGLDSLIEFTANFSDNYFVGVSSFSNSSYDPFTEGSGLDGSTTGEYDVIIEVDTTPEDLAEPNDTISQAIDSGLSSSNPRTFFATSFLGNNDDIAPEADVDLIQFELDAGDRVTIDIDAQVLGSSLDSVLRLFDSEGNEIAFNDDSDSLDSFIDFTASVTDTYIVGVSSFDNFNYDPSLEGSGSGSSTGQYDITIDFFEEDSNGGLENGGFETGTFSSWQTIGDTSIQTAEFGIEPSQGDFQALIVNGASVAGGSVIDSDLEAFLELNPGILDNLGNGDVTEGSAIKQTFTANAGDILTFDWNFLTNEATPDVTFNDFAFFSITPFTQELADTASPIFVDTLAEGFAQETGLQTTSVAISESGTFTLSFGVADISDNITDSALLVDNIQINPSDTDGGNEESEFNIEVIFTDDSLTASQQAVFDDDAARWEEIITGDLPDVVFPDLGLVDDVVIEASALAIDGVGGTLGQAGPTSIRNDILLPSRGIMEFDTDDLFSLESDGLLEDVILHEMGHVLGIGTIWEDLGLLTGAGSDDPRFIGASATAEYNEIFAVNEDSVPVENIGGPGTADSHWRESILDNELLTGFVNLGDNPLSRITVASLADLGYEVDLDAADPYTAPTLGGIESNTVGWIEALDFDLEYVDSIVGYDIALDIDLDFV